MDFIFGKRALRPGPDNSRYSITVVPVTASDTVTPDGETGDPLTTELGGGDLGAHMGQGARSPQGRLVAHTLRVSQATAEDQGVYACHAGPNGAVRSVPVIVNGEARRASDTFLQTFIVKMLILQNSSEIDLKQLS